MALSLDDTRLINDLTNQQGLYAINDERMDRYYEGQQRLAHIGLAVPPELRRFETIVNWCRLALDAVNERLAVKWFTMPGGDTADEALQEGWVSNDLDSESTKHHLDTLIYGRGFVCVGTNAEDSDHPLITVESPRELSVSIDPRTRRVLQAFRVYSDPSQPDNVAPKYRTIYRTDSTSWYELENGQWAEIDRDDHHLGRVPVIPFHNRLRPGRWTGVSEQVDIIPLVDAAARSLTNLQVANETHSVPSRWALGVSKGDFVDADGNQLPVWEAYFTSMFATANKDAKFGQFDATSLSNFHDTVNHYGRIVGALAGLPPHFLGFSDGNPASADAIRSGETRLITRAELKQDMLGDPWGRTMAFYTRLRTGEWPAGRIRTEWQDAGTPTKGQAVDAAVKLHQENLISREGVWDELGWSEARKQRERDYLKAEAVDPVAERLLREAQPPPETPPVVPDAGLGA